MSDMIILKIKDRKYGMRKMPPIRGAAFGIKVANVLSKMLAAKDSLDALVDVQKRYNAMAKPEDGVKDVAANLSNGEALTFGQTIIHLLSQVDPDTVTNIFREAFSYEVYYENVKLSDDVQFDLHFSKFPGDLYVVAVWATYNHVKDFFTGLGDGIQAFMTNSETNQSGRL